MGQQSRARKNLIGRDRPKLDHGKATKITAIEEIVIDVGRDRELFMSFIYIVTLLSLIYAPGRLSN